MDSDTELDWDEMTIIGTNQNLTKEYLRLTAVSIHVFCKFYYFHAVLDEHKTASQFLPALVEYGFRHADLTRL